MFRGAIVVIVGLVVLALQDVSGLTSSVPSSSSTSSVSSSTAAPSSSITVSVGNWSSTTSPTNPTTLLSATQPTKPSTTTSPAEKTCFTLQLETKPQISVKLLGVKDELLALLKKLLGSPNVNLLSQNLVERNTSKGIYVEGEVEVHVTVTEEDRLLKDIVLGWIQENGKFQNVTFVKDNVSFTECKVEYKNWKAKKDECDKCSGGGGGPIVIEGACVSDTGYSCKGLESKKERKTKECVEYCNDSSAVAISSFVLAMGILLSFSFNIWK